MMKELNKQCLEVSCISRSRKIIRCCLDLRRQREELEIREAIRYATGLDGFQYDRIILK